MTRPESADAVALEVPTVEDFPSDIPNSGPVVHVLELLSDILELLTNDESPGSCALPCFCRVAIYPGPDVPWDSCSTGGSCGECDGQLWATLQPITRVAGTSDAGNGRCVAYRFTAQIGAVRCASATLTDDDQNPFPPVEDVQNDAIRQAIDADGIRWALTCCPTRPRRLREAGIVLESWAPLASGDCVGGAWTISGRFDVCC